MDINEKIAARRRELAAEAQKRQAVEAERRAAEKQAEASRRERVEEATAEARLSEEADRAALNRAFARQFQAKGAKIPLSASQMKIDSLLTIAAAEKMTSSERMNFVVFLLLTVGGMLISWWLALLFLVIAVAYFGSVTERHKKEIAANMVKDENEGRFGAADKC